MFKPGDKVVCINNNLLLSEDLIYVVCELELYKTYTVVSYSNNNVADVWDNHNYIKLSGLEDSEYHILRFMPLKEYRKLKLEKLNQTKIKQI